MKGVEADVEMVAMVAALPSVRQTSSKCGW